MHLRSFRLVHFFVLCFYAAPLGSASSYPRGTLRYSKTILVLNVFNGGQSESFFCKSHPFSCRGMTECDAFGMEIKAVGCCAV